VNARHGFKSHSFHVNHDFSKIMYHTSKIEYLYNIYLKITQYNIERTIYIEPSSILYGFESHHMIITVQII